MTRSKINIQNDITTLSESNVYLTQHHVHTTFTDNEPTLTLNFILHEGQP